MHTSISKKNLHAHSHIKCKSCESSWSLIKDIQCVVTEMAAVLLVIEYLSDQLCVAVEQIKSCYLYPGCKLSINAGLIIWCQFLVSCFIYVVVWLSIDKDWSKLNWVNLTLNRYNQQIITSRMNLSLKGEFWCFYCNHREE